MPVWLNFLQRRIPLCPCAEFSLPKAVADALGALAVAIVVAAVEAATKNSPPGTASDTPSNSLSDAPSEGS